MPGGVLGLQQPPLEQPEQAAGVLNGQMPAQYAAERDQFMAQQQQGGGPGGGGPQGVLPAWYNPANWGPPPQMDAQGRISRAPTGGFWSQGDLLRQQQARFGGKLPEVMDNRPNTYNWRLLGNDPGSYMTMGHHISEGKRQADLHQGQNPDGGEGASNWPPIRFNPPVFGPEFPAHFSYGSTARFGIPGQLEPWAIGWEGPG